MSSTYRDVNHEMDVELHGWGVHTPVQPLYQGTLTRGLLYFKPTFIIVLDANHEKNRYGTAVGGPPPRYIVHERAVVFQLYFLLLFIVSDPPHPFPLFKTYDLHTGDTFHSHSFFKIKKISVCATMLHNIPSAKYFFLFSSLGTFSAPYYTFYSVE